MYYLDAQTAPIICEEPQEFTNKQGAAVTLDSFTLPAANRIGLGIWTLQSDPLPDPSQFVVTGETYEPLTFVVMRHWQTRPLTDSEKQALAQGVIQAAVATVSAAINAKRDSILAAGYADTVISQTIQCGPENISDWNAVGSSASAAITMNLNPAPTFEIICASNATLQLSPQDAFALLNGRVMPWVSKIKVNARKQKDALISFAAAPNITPAQVLAFDYSGGWN
jgi:hypothetical protein